MAKLEDILFYCAIMLSGLSFEISLVLFFGYFFFACYHGDTCTQTYIHSHWN